MSWSDASPAAPDAGWYQDPGGSGGLRYWDGRTWTGHVTEPRPPVPAAGPPPYAPAPVPIAAPTAKTAVWVWVVLALVAVSVLLGGVVAVVVPAFRIARDTVWDEEAKRTLRETQAAAASVRSPGGGFLAVTAAELDRVDPFVEHTEGPSTGPEVVSVHVLDDRLTLTLRSRSGTCWVVRDVAAPVGGASSSRGRLRSGQPCSASTVEGFKDESS
ncbi:MAG TPA: DUF2510 domain-containing protein [Acidimicrobiales bacterium]|nr:DUF2510 domain-containing protein [Acidimicrobiales bacterium]